MTLNEFREYERRIRDETFNSSSAPFTYGVERAIFEQNKCKRLIAAAKTINVKARANKVAIWQRQLQKAIKSQARFEKMLAEQSCQI